ncbi:MAG: hypothetical protein DMD50_13045 [Gemmatimonadetes bacterium]|nr:MAG: hypothetical protein DMD50_13045 [Gemmatimonadota bacterium]
MRPVSLTYTGTVGVTIQDVFDLISDASRMPEWLPNCVRAARPTPSSKSSSTNPPPPTPGSRSSTAAARKPSSSSTSRAAPPRSR